MGPLAISAIAFAGIFGGALIGIFIRNRLPEHHLNSDTKDAVKLTVGIIGTMTGMVLGLLVAASKGTFDDERNSVVQLSANVVMLDRLLSHYGNDARETRGLLRDSVIDMLQRMWPSEAIPDRLDPKVGNEGRYHDLYDRILTAAPTTDAQKSLQTQALKIMHDTAQTRWLFFAQRDNTIPSIFLVLLISWMGLTFLSFGLFAPRNATAMVALFMGALVVSSAIFLILELDRGFEGVIQISSQPLRNALSQLGK